MKLIGSIEFELWTIIWSKLKRSHHPFNFYEIYIQIYRWHILAAYQISVLSDIRELISTVGKLTVNYKEKWILSHCDLDL